MKNITIGTAGHVDHGKTTLIKALTGIDTDRLKEEKERGMTIDLGFASLDLPNGIHAGIVDVPGHERFIKNMLAGAGGVDLALLVIAADESVMPQTVEHLEILQLLEVKRGVVALTKADMVEADWIEAVVEDIRKALEGTFLADAPIIPVSSTTGQGLPELLAAIQEAAEDIEVRDSSGPFRLPIDRVFTLTGFGTVVTGTLVAGTVRVGDAAGILPKGLKTRVRQIQVHGHKVESASAGSRVAMNLAGLEVAEIERGDVCATPETLKAASLLDLSLTLLKSAKPLKNGTRIRFHIGTAELLGRLTLLDRDELKPGDQAFAQFRSETPAAAVRKDRFVIRSYSPMTTIGGGVIIEPNARRHRRFDAAVISSLETSSKGSPEELLEQELKQSATGKVLKDSQLLESLVDKGKVIELPGGRLIHASVLAGHAERIRGTLSQFHEKNPLKLGMPKEELRITAAKAFDSKGFASLLGYMEQAGEINSTDTLVSLAGREISLNSEQQAAADRMLETLLKAGINVPSPDELEPREILEMLVQQGQVIKVTQELYFHRETIEQAERTVREYIGRHGKITVSEFRDITGSTRKYALPILEYFDSKKITRRQGDFRVLGSRL